MDVSGKTHTGNIRTLNEDHFYYTTKPIGPLHNLFVVADGMGGHQAGEIASQMAVEGFKTYLTAVDVLPEPKNANHKTIGEHLIQGVLASNSLIYETSLSQSEYLGMGTTFIACTIDLDANMLYVVNVGDSRLYAFDRDLKQVTIDHSYVEELIAMGTITRAESYEHPDKHVITRALGTDQQVKVDVFQVPLNTIEKILLCSDGLTNMVNDEVLSSHIKEHDSVQVIVDALLDDALNAGGTDNITLILVDVHQREASLC